MTNILVTRKCPNINLATIKWEDHLNKQQFHWPNIFKASLNITVDTKLLTNFLDVIKRKVIYLWSYT